MKKFFWGLFLLLCPPLVQADSKDENKQSKERSLDLAYKWYPKYVTFLPSDKLDSVIVHAYTQIVPVIFQSNRTELRSNRQLDSIVGLVKRIHHDKRIKVQYIWVGGSASPEGSMERNRQLGQHRAHMLADYLIRKTGVNSSMFRVENLWEDWGSATRVIKERNFPNKEKLLEIIETEGDWERRKTKIKALDKGITWKYLIDEIFPPFRNARLVIVCSAESVKDFTFTSIPDFIPKTFPLPIVSLVERPTVFTPPTPKEDRFWAVKTNLLFLGALTANAGVEVELWRRWSIDIPLWYSPYDIKSDLKLRLLATQPELRFWPQKAGIGHFFGIHAHLAGFNVALNRHGRYQDPNHALWGAGLGYGFSTHLDRNKRWGLEFNVGAGYANYTFDAYRNWDNGARFRCDVKRNYWGITRLGVSLSYKWYKLRKN